MRRAVLPAAPAAVTATAVAPAAISTATARRPAILKATLVTDLRRAGDIGHRGACVAAQGDRRGPRTKAKSLWRHRPYRGCICASEPKPDQHGCGEPVC